jgi:1-acyl-sn-glycerol-3-phosphate acyltransferase
MLDQGQETLDVKLLRCSLLLLMRTFFRIKHQGMENVPADGPLLIVANHTTYFDPFWVSVRIYRAVRFMAWDKIFKIPIAGRIFRWLGAFPVSLEKPESSAFKAALKVLRKGGALMIFPEGGRSPDGRLMPFKEGAAHLALKLRATILPVAIHGGVRVWGPRMPLPLPRRVLVEYLSPIRPEQFEASVGGLTLQIRQAIQSRLEGQH